MSVASTLAEFVHQSRWEQLPVPVQHEASRVLINWIGCCYGGARHAAVTTALPVLAGLAERGSCTVLGHPVRLGPLDAALAFDDTHLPSITHPSAPTVAAMLAYAQTRVRHGHRRLPCGGLSRQLCIDVQRIHSRQCGQGRHLLGDAGLTGLHLQ